MLLKIKSLIPSFYNNGLYTDLVNIYLSDSMIKDYGFFDLKMVKRFLNKHQNRSLNMVGYRDNMLMVFLLSTQIVNYNIHKYDSHKHENTLPVSLKVVDVVDN